MKLKACGFLMFSMPEVLGFATTAVSNFTPHGSVICNSRASDDDEGEASSAVPQLPAIGDSSFSSNKEEGAMPFVANRKVQLQYTCNVCDTRNTQRISRVSFYKGVVIAKCKGCDTQHLIADHLGWSGFKEQGVLPTTTSVNEEVFELERILQQHDSSTGAIVGEDGMPTME